jgi:hypothetical protein
MIATAKLRELLSDGVFPTIERLLPNKFEVQFNLGDLLAR